ncbi:MAG: hypothetical protein E7582_04320 [Ruminococcaceae bacterium]|nr:hypothetical protein [Oscillospiraceae bacterium]
MKKLVIFLFLLAFCLSGCKDKEVISCPADESEKIAVKGNTEKTLTVVENSVTRLGENVSFEISKTDADIISQVISEGTFTENAPDCINDYQINLGGHLYYYHTSCGTFTKVELHKDPPYSRIEPENKNQYIKLNEENKEKVNGILENYFGEVVELCHGLKKLQQ